MVKQDACMAPRTPSAKATDPRVDFANGIQGARHVSMQGKAWTCC